MWTFLMTLAGLVVLVLFVYAAALASTRRRDRLARERLDREHVHRTQPDSGKAGDKPAKLQETTG